MIVLLLVCRASRAEESTTPSSLHRMLWEMPLVEQSTGYTCGAAAMQGVLAYYGLRFTEEALVKDLGSTPKDGTDHVVMAAYGTKLGLHGVVRSNVPLREVQERVESGDAVIVEAQAWQDEKPTLKPYPEVWNSGHYMIVIGVDEKNVYFVDPSAGLKRGYIPIEEFMTRWHDLDLKQQKLHQTAIFFHGKPKPILLNAGWLHVP